MVAAPNFREHAGRPNLRMHLVRSFHFSAHKLFVPRTNLRLAAISQKCGAIQHTRKISLYIYHPTIGAAEAA